MMLVDVVLKIRNLPATSRVHSAIKRSCSVTLTTRYSCVYIIKYEVFESNIRSTNSTPGSPPPFGILLEVSAFSNNITACSKSNVFIRLYLSYQSIYYSILLPGTIALGADTMQDAAVSFPTTIRTIACVRKKNFKLKHKSYIYLSTHNLALLIHLVLKNRGGIDCCFIILLTQS